MAAAGRSRFETVFSAEVAAEAIAAAAAGLLARPPR